MGSDHPGSGEERAVTFATPPPHGRTYPAPAGGEGGRDVVAGPAGTETDVFNTSGRARGIQASRTNDHASAGPKSRVEMMPEFR